MDISGMMRAPYGVQDTMLLRSASRDTTTQNTATDGTATSAGKTGFAAALENYGEELAEKIKNGETEPTYQIGGKSYTMKEWDKLITRVDDALDTIREDLEERIDKKIEESLEQDITQNLEQDIAQDIEQDLVQNQEQEENTDENYNTDVS